MQSINLIGKRTVVLDNNACVIISYFLEENKTRPMYGIKVNQYMILRRFYRSIQGLYLLKRLCSKHPHKLNHPHVLISTLLETVDDLIV